ncbi:MAG: winged helix-turn-helix domain-containing protein [Candidatus Aenigmatarchaeota archaeon]
MRIESIMGSKSRVIMLRHFCQNPGRDFSIAELARELGVDKSLVSKTVSFFEKENIVKSFRRGNMKLCKLNSGNNVCVVIADMFNNVEGRRR